MAIVVPPLLDSVARRSDGGLAWLDRLPTVVATLAEAWELQVHACFDPGGMNSWVAPVTRTDGTPCVLKITLPHVEATHEADALRAWAGRGAVALLEHDAATWACLLERCDPGTALRDAGLDHDQAADVIADILLQLWDAPTSGPFLDVGEEMQRQAREIREMAAQSPGTVTSAQLDRAVAVLEAGATGERRVLLHRDLHAGNVLLGERGWLAIDPKPHVGPPWCDLGMALVNWTPTPAQADRLCAALDLDRAQVVDYAFAICIAVALWSRSVGQGASTTTLLARAAELV